MLFNSVDFFWFFLIVLPVYYLLPGRHGGVVRGVFLAIASYFFYAYWNPWYLILIFASTILDFNLGKLFEVWPKERHRRLVVISVSLNLGFLAFFKYLDFFAGTLSDLVLVPFFDYRVPTLIEVLPVGISFYTFQTMSYCIDVYRGQAKVERSFWRFALYVTYFPQLVAGPIERAKVLLDELAAKLPRPRPMEPAEGLFQIAYGLFKKMVVADSIGPLVQPVFTNPAAYGGADVLLSACLFSVQIYCDFSGYTDIAIGTSRLFGVRLMRNFRFPYFSVSITEFWRRWHISLSTWLRDYIYIPLGGNRSSATGTYANLMITMLLGGLWHGPSWNFVLWGFCHGALLGAHRFYQERFGRRGREAETGIVSRLLLAPPLFVAVSVIWIPFVTVEFGQTVDAVRAIFTWRGADNSLDAETLRLCLFLVALMFVFDALEAWNEKVGLPRADGRKPAWWSTERLYEIVVRPWLPACFVLLSMVFVSPESRQFIYFQF